MKPSAVKAFSANYKNSPSNKSSMKRLKRGSTKRASLEFEFIVRLIIVILALVIVIIIITKVAGFAKDKISNIWQVLRGG